MLLLEVMHEILDVLHDLDRLRVVHGDADGVTADAQRVRPHVEPPHRLTFGDELLNQLRVLPLTASDSEHNLHAAADLVIIDKATVEAVGVVDVVIQDVRTADREILVERESPSLEHVLTDQIP